MIAKTFAEHEHLIDVLQTNSASNHGITFINSETNEEFLSYPDLYERAVVFLGYFQHRGLGEGDELLFQIEDNRLFLCLFWACLLGKVIPVPLTAARDGRESLKVLNIWETLSHPTIIGAQQTLENVFRFAVEYGAHKISREMQQRSCFVEDLPELFEEDVVRGQILTPNEKDIAFIQFSSGSTSKPKGVVLTHKNLLTNLRAIINGINSSDHDRTISWMPLTHDMGLIGFHLTPIFVDWQQFLIPPYLFIRRPLLWLQKISEHKATLTSSPNFGYKYVLNFFDPSIIQTLDLSSVRLIFNGAEPIVPSLCRQFLHVMSAFGLKKTAMFPVYGLAEACVAVSFSEPEADFVVVEVERNSLNLGQRVIEQREKNENSVSFMGLGTCVENCFLRILGDNGQQAADRVIGHVQIKGDNVTTGYYNDKVTTEQTLTPDGWLDTGDLGFLRDGKLVITGRAKDLIFFNGLHYYAHDIEFVIGKIEHIKLRTIAVCGVYNSYTQKEEIICFAHFKHALKDFLPYIPIFKEYVLKHAGVPISHVIPLKKIPTTTSGKIQRYQLKEAYLNGDYDQIIQELAAFEAKS